MSEQVTVTWGPELFSPVRFHTITVGPFSATTIVKPGETIDQAADRAYQALDRHARRVFTKQKAEFLDRCAEAATEARSRGNRDG